MTQLYEDPPPTLRGRHSTPSRRNVELAGRLRAHEGKWMVGHVAKSKGAADAWAYRVRHGQSPAYQPTGAYDATVRGVEVYVRYVGE